jgi:hypothetical protein
MGYSEELGAEDCLPFREPRLPRMLTVQVRGRRFGAMPAIARNLSDGGMGGTTKQWLVTGEEVEADLPNFGWTRARIAWTDGTRFGLAFLDPVEAGRVSREAAPGMDSSFRVMDRFRPETSMRRPGLRANAA